MKELSVRDCLSAGWNAFKARPWLFVLAGLIVLAASLVADVPRTLAQHSAPHNLVIGFIAFLISTGISFLISMGKTAFYLRAHDAPQAAKLSYLWHPQPYWKYAAVTVLTGAATVIGLILLIVPGIIIGIAFGFSAYIVIEKGSRPLDAMRESAALTKGYRWTLFLLGAALLGINILGFCALLIGLLVTLPVSALAIIHAYRILSGASQGISIPAASITAEAVGGERVS